MAMASGYSGIFRMVALVVGHRSGGRGDAAVVGLEPIVVAFEADDADVVDEHVVNHRGGSPAWPGLISK
jgi:hypothetical protein